ncbi:hypothetical protein DEJ17_04585 [Curtobacterium sp. MCSS17_011]|nr:hypothetical protein DEJ17_04585 [Curtobacterium sp. MCSS17_011]
MSGQQVAMVITGCFVIVACGGIIATSRGLSRAIYEASWGRLGVPFRPRLARTGIIGAGAIGVLIGATVIVLALTVAAS